MVDVKDEIVDFLREKPHLALATVSADGKPMTHPVAFSSDGVVVYVATSANSHKVENIKSNPDVSYSVFDDLTDWMKVRGLQVEGTASLVTDESEIGKMMQLAMEKFPFWKDIPKMPDPAILKITPKRARYSDSNKGFGHMDELTF
ncbi:pyridoxamine 5'-phosphate oxidase family protein [Candidatus Altiarchaeota archaeon]